MKKDELCAQLIQHLKDELKIHQYLLDTVLKEKEFLIAANLEEIKNITQAKEKMIAKINDVEKLRHVTTKQLVQEYKIKATNPRLKDIIAVVDPSYAQELKSLHAGLELYVNRLMDANRQNGALIESALENIRGALGSIKSTLSETTTYKQKGNIEKKALSGQFVSREA